MPATRQVRQKKETSWVKLGQRGGQNHFWTVVAKAAA